MTELTDTDQLLLPIDKCTGCGCCVNICSKKAITMQENNYGFIKPIINNEKCTHCKKCINSCILNKQIIQKKSMKAFAVWANDEVRKKSSSGGVFTILGEHIIDEGGYVCGAAFVDGLHVEHIITNDRKDLELLRGSKYMQSDCTKIYQTVKKLLMNGKKILFVGCPCQVQGINNYLKKKNENLFTVDLICHGNSSHKIFDEYCNDCHFGKIIKNVFFKKKDPWGWRPGMNIEYNNGEKYIKKAEEDPFFLLYLKGITQNTACDHCIFNNTNRPGDLTIGDYWGIDKFDKRLNDNKGTSVVLINSQNGQLLFENVKNKLKLCVSTPLEYAINGNRSLRENIHNTYQKQYFIRNFSSIPFGMLANSIKNNKMICINYEPTTINSAEEKNILSIIRTIETAGYIVFTKNTRCLTLKPFIYYPEKQEKYIDIFCYSDIYSDKTINHYTIFYNCNIIRNCSLKEASSLRNYGIFITNDDNNTAFKSIGICPHQYDYTNDVKNNESTLLTYINELAHNKSSIYLGANIFKRI